MENGLIQLFPNDIVINVLWQGSRKRKGVTVGMHTKLIKASQENAASLRWLADKCSTLDVHTPFTYWVMTRYFSNSTFIAKRNDKYAGYIMSIYNEKEFFVWQIGILEEFRGQGLAYELIDQVVEVALDKGYSKIVLTIADENKESYYTFVNYSKHRGYSINKKEYIEVKDISNPEFMEREAMYEIHIK